MKKFLIKTAVFLVSFITALLVTERIMNRDNNSTTREMAAPTLPVITMENGGVVYNELHGMLGNTDIVYQRDTITVLGDNRELGFRIDTFGEEVKSIVMEVRSCDGTRLIEKTSIEQYDKKGNVLTVQTSLKDLLTQGEEYALVIVLTDESDREIRYYTRLAWESGLYAPEKLQFVYDFHQTTFNDEELGSLAKYMESNSKGNNKTLHKVNIHSSLSQVGWGDLEVYQATEPIVDLKEIVGSTASMTLRNIVYSGEKEDKVYYFVEEYYRIRYTADRVYLLDFERTMTQIPDVKGDIYANDKIMLGIVQEDTPMMESEDGNVVVFQAANRLCSYNLTTNKLALLFSFYDENADQRSLYNQHNIKILDIDEGGNVAFVVYGYMNRGRHEGEVGIQLYIYDSAKNTIEENLYIPYEKSYAILSEEIEQLLYLNRENILYLYLNHRVYAVNTMEKTVEVLAVMENDTSVEISGNQKLAVWHLQNGLELMDLAGQTKVTISPVGNEYLYPLGFMGEDLVYGAAVPEDIATSATGSHEIHMNTIYICDIQGKILKEYNQENIYITSCIMADNQITLKRVEKDEKGNYSEIADDYIVNNAEVTEGKNKISVVAVDIYERIVQIDLRSNIDDKTIQILTPKEVVFEGARDTLLEAEEEGVRYYVYAEGGVNGIYANPATALQVAYITSGTVMDETGKTVWVKGNRVAKNQIMAIKEQSVSDTKGSLAVCLETILRFEGITLDAQEALDNGETAVEILGNNLHDARVVDLTGCNLDTILYFTNRDIPVLATLEDGEAVLVVGFNQYNVVIMEPKTGKLYKKGMNDSTQWFEENGNQFVTYFRIAE